MNIKNTFVFANIQSMNGHHSKILADKCFMNAKFLLFVETHTLSTDNVDIPGCNAVYRKDCEHRIHGYGIVIYSKKSDIDDEVKIVFESNVYAEKQSHNVVAFTYKNYCICTLYKLPDTNVKDIL